MSQHKPPSDPQEERVIQTKRGAFRIDPEQEGLPIEEYWPRAKVPPSMKGTKVYFTAYGRPVFALPPPDRAKDSARSKNEAAKTKAQQLKADFQKSAGPEREKDLER